MKRFTAIAAAVMMGSLGLSPALAQTQGEQSHSQTQISLPPQQSILDLSVENPGEVRVGDEFEYRLTITNNSDNFVVHNIKLERQGSDKISIESARFQSDDKQHKKQKSEKKDKQQANKEKKQNKNQASDQQANKQSDRKNKSDKKNKNQWTIKKLEPGESKTLVISAASDSEGTFNSCIAVTSYQPAMCLTTRFVKPELEVVKRAPEEASLCDPIEVEYYVKNDGSGDLAEFKVRDDLADGLQTESGDDHLEFTVDGGLKAGDVRKFVATLTATKAGEFTSRAVAMHDGQETRSSKTTTTVQQADLAVAIDGPSTTYVDRPVTYTVRVSNNGNVAANDARVDLLYSNQITLQKTGDIRDSGKTVESSSSSDGNQPTPADDSASDKGQTAELARNSTSDGTARSQENQSQQQRTAAKPNQSSQTWEIGSLEPGMTREMTITLSSNEAGMMEPTAVASYVCSADEDQARTKSIAYASTEVISLPALLITVVDLEDPVPINGSTVYRIDVKNQGTAADHDVQINATIPDGFEFVRGEGDTEVSGKNGQLKIKPVDKLEAGDTVSWRIEMKPTSEGDKTFTVELSSKSLDSPTTSEEPTKIYKEGSQNENSDSSN